MPIKIAAVVGPTASGKTRLAIEVANALDGEIVSCDSMQLYQGMEIATAKPTAHEQSQAPHHMVDFLAPNQKYSAAKYVVDAAAVVEKIAQRQKLPVLAGGTGLYLDSLLQGISFLEDSHNEAVRNALYRTLEEIGNDGLHARLAQIDPEYAKIVHPNNVVRVVRALEQFEITGKTMTWQLANSKQKPSDYQATIVGINFSDRALLYDRINRRVDVMIENGLVQEAEAFFKHEDAKTATQAIGIKELLPYFQGEQPLSVCIDKIKQETRRYAKRQLTWFGRNPNIHWLLADQLTPEQLTAEAVDIIKKGLNM